MIREGKEALLRRLLSHANDSEKCEGVLQQVFVFYNAPLTFLIALWTCNFLNRLRDTSRRFAINSWSASLSVRYNYSTIEIII